MSKKPKKIELRQASPRPAAEGSLIASSPYSSGGGGVTLERRVATLYLARLLTGTTSVELEARRVTRVAFQQAPAKPVDDLVVYAARDGEADPSLEVAVAVRRAPVFVPSDTRTKKLLVDFLQALRGGARADGMDQRFVICVAGNQTSPQQVGELAGLAQRHPADSFFELLRTPGKFRRELIARLSSLLSLVTGALDVLGEEPSVPAAEKATWELLSRLRVLMPRVESSEENDWAELLNLLEPWSREQTLAGAASLRDRLESLAAAYGPKAAVVDLPMLRRDAHDVLNQSLHRNQRSWTALRRLDQDARDAVRTVMGLSRGAQGKRLTRAREATALHKRIGEDPHLLVRGESGVGKSALVLRELIAIAEAEPDRLQFVFLNLRLLPRSIPELRCAVGCALEEVFAEVSAPIRLLVVDAAEYVLESNSDVLDHLLRAARRSDLGVWVITPLVAASAVRTALETALSSITEHEIAPLDDADLDEMGTEFPQLRNLLADSRSRELLRKPALADLFVRAGTSDQLLSDADALSVVWKKLVRASSRTGRGTPDSRDQVLRQLATHHLQQGPGSSLYPTLDPVALDGLRRDGLLRSPSVPWLVLPEFAHEILRTYSMCQVLLADGNPVAELQALGAPRWALPAARLAAQVLLCTPESHQMPTSGRLEKIQEDFDQLAAAGHGERWSDLPVEAVLRLPQTSSLLDASWTHLLASEALGLRRVLRLLRQQHERAELADLMVSEPVVKALLREGWPKSLEREVERLLCGWLRGLIVANEPEGNELRLVFRSKILQFVEEADHRLKEEEAKRLDDLAARTPEEVQKDERREREYQHLLEDMFDGVSPRRWVELPTELIRESTLERLALLGPDLGKEGEGLLRRVARDAPQHLAPALESLLTGRAIAAYSPPLLTELAKAYYLDDTGAWWSSLNYGIRDHHSHQAFGPLAAFYRGPFLVMFETDFRRAVTCLNGLLNHAARVRAAVLLDRPPSSPGAPGDPSYRTVLSISGEPRTYIGDSHVWLWYRGSGVGPYPCMSALQALEVVCDRFIEAGIGPGELAPILLEGCENLAMPALVLGLLVRNLERAGEALDPYLVEPVVWRLEFNRVVAELSGLRIGAQSTDGSERRKWSLREAAVALVLSAEGERVHFLSKLGDRLIARARELDGRLYPDIVKSDEDERAHSEELAAVCVWAEALRRDSYRLVEREGGLVVEQAVAEDVRKVLEPGNQNLARGQQATGLALRYAGRRDHSARPLEVSLAELQADLATVRALVEEPSTAAIGGPLVAPAAVAAGALELRFVAGEAVPLEELEWSARLLVGVVLHYASRGAEEGESSVYSLGADRSAARGIPFVFLPDAEEIRAALRASGITSALLTDIARWLTSSSPNEAKLLYAQAMDSTWRAPCDNRTPAKCHHGRAIKLLENSARPCILGTWDPKTRQSRIQPLKGPIEEAVASLAGEKILVPRLSAAIRALGVAANTPSCCTARAEVLLESLLTAHRLGMAMFEDGYHFRKNDTLVAARALLQEAANGKEGLLWAHVEQYIGSSRLLTELLRALAAAAEENATVAAAARRTWPRLMDRVLDLIGSRKRPRRHDHFGSAGLAALIPNRASEYSYLRRELEAEPIDWSDLLAWRKQVERWLTFGAGQSDCVDALVQRLRLLGTDQQAATGLPWVEALVRGAPSEIASRSWSLPDWLKEVRPHARSSEQMASWQRIVDMLMVAGELRVADLAD